MRSQTSSRYDDVSPLSNGRLCAGACEKIARTFAHSVSLLEKIILPSLVCVCIELCPSNATKAPSISTLTASVEAPYLHFHFPLPAYEDVSSSWRLVVVCALITTVQPSLGSQAGTSLVPPGITHYIREHHMYVRDYRVCTGTRGSPVECVRTLCDVLMAYLGEYMHIFGDDF